MLPLPNSKTDKNAGQNCSIYYFTITEKRRDFLNREQAELGRFGRCPAARRKLGKAGWRAYVKQAGARSVFLGHLLMSAVGSGFLAVLPVVSNSQPVIGNSFSDGRRLDKLQERPFRQRCVRSWRIAIRHLPRG